MARAPVGQRIRKRRQELGQSQTALAKRVGISPSYLNLIEHNKRAIGGALLNRIAEATGLDSRALAGSEEARLIAELGEVAADSALVGGLGPEDAGDVVATSPKAARAILALYRAYREARLRTDLIGERLGEDSFLAEASNQILALITTIHAYSQILKDHGDLTEADRHRFVATLAEESERLAQRAGDMFDFLGGRGARRPRPAPREEVEDFLSDRANYFPRLETAADETLSVLKGAPTVEALSAHLKRRHAMAVEQVSADELPVGGERVAGRRFALADDLDRVSVRFRLARLIGTLEYGEVLDEIAEGAALSSVGAAGRLGKVLASYFAGALIMPYAPFFRAAEEMRMDLSRLGNRFDASFEQVCHRLTTLRRPGSEGVPLHFLRTDVAGNISKRFSVSGLRLPRYGGACPRWIVHHAFAFPGRIVTQVGRLPDGEMYFCVARTTAGGGRAESPRANHAVMIGAGIAHIRRFVYGDGVDPDGVRQAEPIGITCRQCPREDCVQRALERAPVLGAPAGLAEAR